MLIQLLIPAPFYSKSILSEFELPRPASSFIQGPGPVSLLDPLLYCKRLNCKSRVLDLRGGWYDLPSELPSAPIGSVTFYEFYNSNVKLKLQLKLNLIISDLRDHRADH